MSIREISETIPGVEHVSRQAVQDQLERILHSSLFNQSRHYPRFLSYVVARALEGHGYDLKERSIGVEVFDRDAGYDLAADPVVRRTAGEVRKRLAQYYYLPEHSEELRIELHPGSYQPEFRVAHSEGGHASTFISRRVSAQNELPKSHVEVGPDETSFAHAGTIPALKATSSETSQKEAPNDVFPSASSRPLVGRQLVWSTKAISLLVVMLTLIGCGVLAVVYNHRAATARDQFWEPVLKTPTPVLISVGTLGSLAPAPDGINVDTDARGSNPVALSDTVAVEQIQQFLARRAMPSSIKTSSQTSFSDLQHGPVVLVAGFDNAWTMRLTEPLRFHFQQNAQMLSVVDRQNPAGAQWKIDSTAPYSQKTRDFGIIARFRDPISSQIVVVAAGIGEDATVAAGQMLASENMFDPDGRNPALRSKYCNMEAVIETQLINGKNGPPHIVAMTFW